MTISELLLDYQIPVLYAHQTVHEAIELHQNMMYKYLPVVDHQNHFLGISDEQKMLEYNESSILSSLYFDPVIHFTNKNHWLEVMGKFPLEHVSIVPVIDLSNDEYMGAISAESLFTFVKNQSFLKEEGAILVLEIPYYSYSLQDLVRIIESEQTKIVYLNIHQGNSQQQVEITLKINNDNVRPIVGILERSGYQVLSIFNETHYNDFLKERYDSLLNFLNI
jgi:Mg/Co/Ni transporter MgtE